MAVEEKETKVYLQLILEKINAVEQGQKELKQGYKSLEQRLELGLQELKQDLKGIAQRMEQAQKELKQEYKSQEQSMDQGFKKLEQKAESLEKRQDEILNAVKGIEHANGLNKTQIDKKNQQLANLEGTLHQIGDVIKKNIAG